MAKVAHLDPVQDHEELVKWMVVETWTFDLVHATEVALLKTFSIPAIATILVNSGEFLTRQQKRYDDTDLLLSLFIEHGYSSREGRQAIQKINRMHARHPITNDQMLYVLATFVVEPQQWLQRFGWRRLTAGEEQALFTFWTAVGKLMGIQDLFPSLAAMMAYHEAYERQFMVFSDDNARLYHAVVPVLSRSIPFPLGALIPRLLPLLMSKRLCAAFGVAPGPDIVRAALGWGLRLRGHLSRLWPSRQDWRTKRVRPTYPEGFSIQELGVAAPATPVEADQKRRLHSKSAVPDASPVV